MKLETRDPALLTIHPAAKGQPEWAEDDARFECLIEDVRDRGVTQPIIIDREDRVVDGRHRRRAARRLQLKEVPVQVCHPDEVASIIIATLIHRRHFTPGQLAYLAFPAFAKAYEESKARRLAALKKDPNGLKPAKTVEAMAAEIGVCRDLFMQAAKVHEAFEADPALKEQFEPRILAQESPAGLGAVVAGISGKKATKDIARPEPKQFELFTEAFDTLTTRFAYWAKFDGDERKEALNSVRDTVAAMPADLRKEIAAEIKRLDK